VLVVAADGSTGRARTKPKRAESGNDMRYVAMICRGQQRFSAVCR
jgi:hypothetical protein